ncbi:MAG: hypothetical protein ACHQX1_01570 [Candidatus Micrarchaeales archaeon]
MVSTSTIPSGHEYTRVDGSELGIRTEARVLARSTVKILKMLDKKKSIPTNQPDSFYDRITDLMVGAIERSHEMEQTEATATILVLSTLKADVERRIEYSNGLEKSAFTAIGEHISEMIATIRQTPLSTEEETLRFIYSELFRRLWYDTIVFKDALSNYRNATGVINYVHEYAGDERLVETMHGLKVTAEQLQAPTQYVTRKIPLRPDEIWELGVH